MGRYSYWIAELESVRTAEDAARMLDAEDFGVSIDCLEDVWVVCDKGRPQFWMSTRAEADEIANRPGATTSWTVEFYQVVWRVCIGDQYIFTTSDEVEAEGFVLGMAAQKLLAGRPGTSN